MMLDRNYISSEISTSFLSFNSFYITSMPRSTSEPSQYVNQSRISQFRTEKISIYPARRAYLKDKIAELDGLVADVVLSAVKKASNLLPNNLPPPQILPTADGGIAFIWNTFSKRLELCFEEDGYAVWFLRDGTDYIPGEEYPSNGELSSKFLQTLDMNFG